MELRQELSTRLLQKMVLTPQLQQAIRLLQLSRQELVEEINTQMESNPTLEEESDDSGTITYEEATRDVPSLESPPVVPSDDGSEGDSGREAPNRQERAEREDWEKYVDDYNRFTTGPSIQVGNEDFPSVESTVSPRTTLGEHLMWQLNLSELTGPARHVGILVIGNLNEDGYLVDMTIQELAAQAQTTEAVAVASLTRIQTFDPVGVAARNLAECLSIQARVHHADDPRLQILVERYLPELERRNYATIARGLKCSMSEVAALVETVLLMEPRPGRAFASSEVVYVQPDVYVYKVGDEYVVTLNEDGLPRLRISPYYEETLRNKGGGQARDFIKEKLRSAEWLIRSIHQRNNTIRRVTESIVRFQRDFLEKGVAALRPLVLREVADDIGMHESTVSRVTTSKYVHTPRGIFELKYFFNSRIGSFSGEDQSSESVKARIKLLIDAEDANRPLSDQEIVTLLRKENIDIARRTVAKYRQGLGVLTSARRKSIL